jgi:hypothetical protein
MSQKRRGSVSFVCQDGAGPSSEASATHTLIQFQLGNYQELEVSSTEMKTKTCHNKECNAKKGGILTWESPIAKALETVHGKWYEMNNISFMLH